MKQPLHLLFAVLLLLCGAGNRAAAQSFGMEQNTNGSYTFTWPDGSSITTSNNGSYSASNGSGSCSGCVQMLPEVVVYGYRNNSNNTYSYTSYNYNGTYYNLPPDPSNPPPTYTYGAPPATVISTAPTPVVTPPPVNNPCTGTGSNQNNTNSPYSVSYSGYASTVSSLTSTLSTDANEKSSMFGVNTTNGQFITTPVVTGGAGSTGSVTIPPGMVPFGAMHTHTSNLYPAPSAGDIYALATAYAAHSSYSTSYVLAADGTRYALVVQDGSKLATFVSNNPAATTVSGASWIPNSNPTGIYHDWLNAYNSYNPSGGAGAADEAAFENAQAYILSAYNTGVVLMKADASGKFNEVHIVRTTDAGGNVKYSVYKCN